MYNAAEQKIVGKVSDEPMTEYPKERGLYLVRVEFVTKDNPNFFPKSDYAEGYLVIVKASTTVNVEKSYWNTVIRQRCLPMTLLTQSQKLYLRATSNFGLQVCLRKSIVKVQYKDTNGSFVDVAPSLMKAAAGIQRRVDMNIK